MQFFPTQYSTLSSGALYEYVKQQYGLPLTKCTLLLHGVSDTYVLHTESTKYILKIYRSVHRTLEEVKGEVELLNILTTDNCKVAYPIADLSGEYVQQFHAPEGARYGVVTSYAAGKATNDLTPEMLAIVGREMAAIHNATASVDLKYTRQEYNIYTTLERPLKILEGIFAEYKKDAEYQWLTEASAAVAEQLNSFDTAALSTGYCHYDYFPKNFFFDTENNFTVFDFDFAGKGYLANDLASIHVYFFLWFSMKKITAEESSASFNTVVAGYRERRYISDAELKAVPSLGFALLLFYLGFQYENHDDWSNTFWGPNYLSERLATMKKYKEQYCDC